MKAHLLHGKAEKENQKMKLAEAYANQASQDILQHTKMIQEARLLIDAIPDLDYADKIKSAKNAKKHFSKRIDKDEKDLKDIKDDLEKIRHLRSENKELDKKEHKLKNLVSTFNPTSFPYSLAFSIIPFLGFLHFIH